MLLFWNLGVGDIPVDVFFNTNFSFSEFCGVKMSKLTSKLRWIVYGTVEQQICQKKFVLNRKGIENSVSTLNAR